MKSIKTKVILNLSSTALPMAFGLYVIPLLIEGIGLERFGMLSIAWMLVGYFGLLDMGLGRALTQKIAHKIGTDQTDNLLGLVWKTLAFIFIFGLLGASFLAFSAQWLVTDLLNLSNDFQNESLMGIYWIALTIPFVIISTALFGVLEGQQHFGRTAMIRAPLGVLMFMAPLITMHYSTSLEWLLASLFLVRFLISIILIMTVIASLKAFSGWTLDISEIKSLFTFGGWVTISNLVSPMMVYFDRFYIGAVLSVAVVAFYTTPFDLLTKALIIPFALVGVMFASFSTDWQSHPNKVIKQFKISMIVIAVTMLPLCLLIFYFAKPALAIWINESFSNESYLLVQWMALGIFINALAMIPFAFIQATGRADLTAKLHLLELPFYGLLLWFLIETYGLIGAPMAWVVRVALDMVALMILSFFLMIQRRTSCINETIKASKQTF